MNIRFAAPSEAENLVSLINAAFRVEKFFIEEDRINLNQVLSFFQKGDFLVAEEDDSFAGCMYVEPRGDRAYLGLLSIDPARQRGGIGSRMVAFAEDWARQKGYRFMDLRIVNLREELPPFYRRLGYVETGTDPFPPGTPTKLPCHFINMSKPL
ncbi:MAG TPA: GNAT family N-acetyltransferase [Bryobacteraceae bacterium]|nr:GNAT family N-acetyltransferase [Bryobacteraceae bacterium]